MQRSPIPDDLTRSGRVVFWCYVLHLWTVFGLALSNLIMGLGLVAAPWGLRSRRVDRRLLPVLLPLALYGLFLLVSIALSYEPRESFVAAGELLSLSGLFVGLVLVRGEREVRWILDGLIAVTTVLGLLALTEYLAGHGGIELRLRGPFSHYMTLAGVLLMADIVLLTELLCGVVRRNAWRWMALVILNLALVGTLTRSAWVALAVALTVVLMLRKPRLLMAYLPAMLIWLVVAPVPLVHRAGSIFDLQEISNYDRICMMEAGLHMVRERPLFGLGPQMVAQRYPIYRHPTAARQRVPHLHNSYIQIAAEQGVLSLAVFLWLMIGALVAAMRGYRRQQAAGGGQVDLYLGAGAALLAFTLAGIFEHNWGDSEVQRVALLMLAVPYCLTLAEERAPLDRPAEGGASAAQ